MQSLKEVNNFGIKKDMNLAQLMSVVEDNLHGESTIQIQEFKKSSKATINPQLFDFFPLTEKGEPKTNLIAGFGIQPFLDIMSQSSELRDKVLSDAYIEKDRTVFRVPEFKVDIECQDYCRFYSLKNKQDIENKITSNYYNKKNNAAVFPVIHGMGYRRVEDTEFITNNIRREIKPDKSFTALSSPNIFKGVRNLKELEQLLDYFGKDNYHKVVASNEEQGYALVHKITVKVDFPHTNYFQFSQNSDLVLNVYIEIFHQYFLSGRNDEGGYFITAVIFPDPDMLLDLIRTQDFKPFLTWFNREDQGYQRIQGDILYKIISENDLSKHVTLREEQPVCTIFQNIELDTLYYDYLHESNAVYNYDYLLKQWLENKVEHTSKIIQPDDIRRMEKQLMGDHIGEKTFNFSHHNIRSFGSRKNKLTNHIQMVSKDRINQYILVYGATRCILQHEQHEARALSIPKDSLLLISHQRGKDITNLFAD